MNIYCDESCHLENDESNVMVLGGVLCPLAKRRRITDDLRIIKARHNIPLDFEIKWVKVSPAKLTFYKEVVRYFFTNPDLNFRALIVPDKKSLDHERFNQTHDDWYYKMYFEMLKAVLNPTQYTYNIYIDYKDTNGPEKVKMLHKVLSYNNYDFSMETIKKIQLVRSDELELLPLADLLIGTICYANRGLKISPAKVALVEEVRRLSNLSLTRTTMLGERKFNLFKWEANRYAK